MVDTIVPVPDAWAARAQGDPAADYARSLSDPDAYWRDAIKQLDWIHAPATMDESSFDEATFAVRWFADGVLNVSANCIDRHLATRGGENSDHLGTRRTIGGAATLHLPPAPCRSLPLRQCPEIRGREKGRSRHPLSADDPRSGVCDARLRADRRDPLGRVRPASLPTRSPGASPTAIRASSSPPTKAVAAASACR